MACRSWINGDESAKEMLSRVSMERPLLLLPPLHRVPLRVGNVVEIVGPSPSAKSEILIQASINCVLPKEWNGVHYGGLERLVVYFDLDCRFDITRLAQLLKHRIIEAKSMVTQTTHFDEELFQVCLRRFLYIRCYSSFEFLAALKTMRFRLQKEIESHGVHIHFLMIDSISAFYWVDRASKPLPFGGNNRKGLSLQSVTETVVKEIRKLLQAQPMLVLATKPTILGMGVLPGGVKRTWSEQDTDSTASNRGPKKHFYHEYMPSVWQLFVTHRILLSPSAESFADAEGRSLPMYVSEWILPSLKVLDKFAVRDVGIFMVT